jgi:hypothetical protein
VHAALLCMRLSSATSCTRNRAYYSAQHCTVILTNFRILYHVLAHSYRFNKRFFARRGEERKRRAGHVTAFVLSSLPYSGRTSAAHQPLPFASTPTLSPPRRCDLYLMPFNSMSARPPHAPGLSTCQMHRPRIAKSRAQARRPPRPSASPSLHYMFMCLIRTSFKRDTRFSETLVSCPRLSRASTLPSQAQGAPPQAAQEPSLLRACHCRSRCVLLHHLAYALAAVRMISTAAHAAHCRVAYRVQPCRAHGTCGTRGSAGRASISCLAIRAHITLFDGASAPWLESRWVTRGRAA